jgi:predicted transcriptional regulator
MSRELTRREMQVLAFVDQHQGEDVGAQRISDVIGMDGTHVRKTLRLLRGIGLVEYEEGLPEITQAGRKMLWPFIDFV